MEVMCLVKTAFSTIFNSHLQILQFETKAWDSQLKNLSLINKSGRDIGLSTPVHESQERKRTTERCGAAASTHQYLSCISTISFTDNFTRTSYNAVCSTLSNMLMCLFLHTKQKRSEWKSSAQHELCDGK